MIGLRQQRGAALFVGIFLITVVVVVAAVVALTSATQHLSQARADLAEQAWYAAVARLEGAAQHIADNDACPPTGAQALFDFQTVLDCARQPVDEGADSYGVYTLDVTASRGNLNEAVFVRRTIRSQVMDGDIGP
ncbi:MAG: hypothetical protein HND55_07790 [Pseudomonadota bacterium]|nr:MAG: hypothetical protein HND55_07790 [Pseudomonadota bacterium]